MSLTPASVIALVSAMLVLAALPGISVLAALILVLAAAMVILRY